MMHRYVAVVATTDDKAKFHQLVAQLTHRLRGWTPILATSLARAWSLTSLPSQLSHRLLGRAGCLIGLDFPSTPLMPHGEEDPTSSSILKTRWGAYVAITVDEGRKSVDIIRDPTGRVECWRISFDGADVYFSHYEDVCGLHEKSLSINWDYIHYHLHNDWNHGAETGYNEVTEILPGEEVIYTSGRSKTGMSWWPDRIAESQFESIDDAQAAIRTATEQAISQWASRYETIALNLSGGLDSAIVLGVLRRHVKHPNIIGMNYVIPDIEGDERSYARDAARLHSVDLIEREVSAANAGEAPSFSRRLMRPTMRSMSVGYDEASTEVAKQLSVDAIFTGTGGDHVFYDHLSVDAACDYRRQRGDLSGLIATAHALSQISRRSIWSAFGAVLTDVVGRRPPLHAHRRSENPHLSLKGRADPDYRRFAHPWAIQAWANAPPAKRNQILNITELQRHYFRYGLADVAEEVHPLVSQPLVEVCLKTPAYWFGVGGIQRGLARRAFSDLLPDSIRNRRTKSFNSSHWLQVMERELPMMREVLLDGHLVAQGLLDRASLETALTPLVLAGNRKFGALVQCFTTEVWVRQAEEDQRSRPIERQFDEAM